MGVSILSYDGRIQFGVITDAGLVPDPDAIVERFARRVRQALWITLMSPWGEERSSAAPTGAAQPSPPQPRGRRGSTPSPEALQEPLTAATTSISTR